VCCRTKITLYTYSEYVEQIRVRKKERKKERKFAETKNEGNLTHNCAHIFWLIFLPIKV
jgi:hypothetical protein